MHPLDTITIRRYTTPPFGSPGGWGGGFLWETPRDWSYSKKENEKQKINCIIKIVRNLHQGGKLANFEKEMKKNVVSFLGCQ